jgi:predicted RNA-binding protein with RPS1 domain
MGVHEQVESVKDVVEDGDPVIVKIIRVEDGKLSASLKVFIKLLSML